MKYFLFWLSFLFIFSCSRVELIYQFAPKVTADKIDDVFDFDSDHYKEVREQIKTDLANNKKEIVKNAVEIIDQALAMANKENPTLLDFQNLSHSVRAKQKTAVYLFKPSFEKVILNLTEGEVKNIFTYSIKKFSKNDEMLNDKKPFVEKKVDDFDRMMGFLFDAFTEEQKNIYTKFIESNFEYFKSQALARKELVNQFTWPIKNKEDLVSYALKYYSGDSSVHSAQYVSQLNTLDENITQLQFDLWTHLNKKQKIYFKEKLARLKTDLLKLAEK